MSWTNEKTLDFVEALELEEAIWNPKHEGHKDRNIVHDSWCTLQRKFDTPVKELKKKKENVFSTYRKYARKVADSMKSGSGTDDIYKPTWFLYDAIDRFLHAIYRPGRTINSMENENGDENGSEEFEAINTTQHDTEEMNLPSTSSANHSEQIIVNPGEKEAPPIKSVQIERKNRKRKLATTQELTNRMGEALDVLKTVTAQPGKSHSPPKRDRLELFTDLLLEKLRNLDEATQELAMHQIDNLMFELKNVNIRRILDSGVLQDIQPTSASSILRPKAPYNQQRLLFPIHIQPSQQSYYAQPQPPLISRQSQPPPYLQSSTSLPSPLLTQQSYCAQPQPSPNSHQSQPSPNSQSSASSPSPLLTQQSYCAQPQPSPNSHQSQPSPYSQPPASSPSPLLTQQSYCAQPQPSPNSHQSQPSPYTQPPASSPSPRPTQQSIYAQPQPSSTSQATSYLQSSESLQSQSLAPTLLHLSASSTSATSVLKLPQDFDWDP